MKNEAIAIEAPRKKEGARKKAGLLVRRMEFEGVFELDGRLGLEERAFLEWDLEGVLVLDFDT